MAERFEDEMVEFGLTRNEARIYLALCKAGPSTASQVSASSGIYRPSTYDSLSQLQDKGLVTFVVIEGRKFFKAADPERLGEVLQRKRRLLDRILPLLHRGMGSQESPAAVEIYQGPNATTMIFRDILDVLKRTRVEHLGMGVDEELFLQEEPFFSGWFVSQLEKYRIREKMITFEGAVHFAGGGTTEYRFIPKELFNPTATLIDDDMVSIIFWTKPQIVIKIVSKELADSYRKQFHMLWRLGKPGKWKKSKDVRHALRKG
ncbi:MAG: helix-turn-helix domain-containing protein [Candidatus Micrarchaeota archaeon]